MNRKQWIVTLAALILAFQILGADAQGPVKPAAKDKCPVCGMFVAKYPDFLAAVVWKDGTASFFDGVKDMSRFLSDVGKYRRGAALADVKSILVTDYYTMRQIDGTRAWYVVDSDVYGPMGKELIPFETETAAKEFLRDHQGRKILRFGDITPGILRSLD